MQCQSTIPIALLWVTFSLASFPTLLGAGKRIPWPRRFGGINKWQCLTFYLFFHCFTSEALNVERKIWNHWEILELELCLPVP